MPNIKEEAEEETVMPIKCVDANTPMKMPPLGKQEVHRRKGRSLERKKKKPEVTSNKLMQR